MAKFNDEYYKNILSKLLRLSLSNPEPAKELIDQMFEEPEFKEQAICLCESYIKPKYRKSTLIAKSIDIRALSALIQICKREKIGIIPLDFTEDEDKIYQTGDKINILILSLQEEEFEKAALEACGVSGSTTEIKRLYADMFAKKISKKNPMIEILNVNENTYEAMKKQMNKLPYALRFTFFPEKNENGKINVGFFSQTQPVLVNNGIKTKKEGPYSIPKIASVLLACALLEDPYYEQEKEEAEKREKEYLQAMMGLYYGSEEEFYIVPALISKDNQLNVFMDRAQLIDITDMKTMSYLEYGQYIQRNSGMNHTLVPMTQKEYEQYKSEVMINPKNLTFYKENKEPVYEPMELAKNAIVSERLIDILNRKREQILLMSDDIDGKNLSELDNYISGTVHELIMRDDEELTDMVELNELLDTKEMELISDLEASYQLSYVYEDHDKVTELINAERQDLESFRSKADHMEMER